MSEPKAILFGTYPDDNRIGELSLRDWFAGHALVGLLNSEDGVISSEVERSAYLMADRMMKERKNVS